MTTASLAALLVELHRRGVRIEPDPETYGRLLVRGFTDDALLSRIRQCRIELLRHLATTDLPRRARLRILTVCQHHGLHTERVLRLLDSWRLSRRELHTLAYEDHDAASSLCLVLATGRHPARRGDAWARGSTP